MNKLNIKKTAIIAITGCMLAMLASSPVFAGVINLRLEEIMAASDPDTPLPVIIRLTDSTHSAASHASPVAAGKIAELLQENAAASQGLIAGVNAIPSPAVTGADGCSPWAVLF